MRQGDAAECRFFQFHTAFRQRPEFRNQPPSFGAADAVRNREVFPLLRLHIVFSMGVQSKDYLRSLPLCRFDFFFDLANDSAGFRRSQRSVHKIHLHIYNDQ